MGTAVGATAGSLLFGAVAFAGILMCRPKGGYPKEDFEAYHRYHLHQQPRNSAWVKAFQPAIPVKKQTVAKVHSSPIYEGEPWRVNGLYASSSSLRAEEPVKDQPVLENGVRWKM